MKAIFKSLLLSAFCFAGVGALHAQAVYEPEVATVDRHATRAYREGEVIVKFKPTSRVKVSAVRGAVTTAVSGVDAILGKLGVTEVEQLMPLSGAGGPQRTRGYNGGYVESDDMSKLYRLRLNTEGDVKVHQAIDELQALAEVEFAEPNYLVYSTVLPTDDKKSEFEDEPLFKEQWAFNAIELKHVWTKKTITDKRPVIAILDTGVDITHPDLDDNIWTNDREANGAEDADDDANGYKDDLHGWDFVNQTARIGDWNGHGTHVAGIAAAEGKNGQGITGANPDALIMPVTVMQSDGTGDVATIIKGIDYAAANGADVINMSFGGYGYSIAEEQALARAYSKAVLVAAAGNDCLPINPTTKCEVCKNPGSQMFPAAFTFVLGVESSNRDGGRASFSNYDDDGPTFSAFGEEKLYNYELRAPGVAMMSTFPGGKYKALNGTSMASPLVAGAISRLLQCKEYDSKEVLFGDLIHARKKNDKGIVDFKAVYEIKDEDRKPTLQFVTYALVDSIGGDGDSRPDAGETIELYPTFRNEWGNAENITFSLEVAEAEDPTIIEILENNVSFGKPLSSYGKAKSEKPIRFKINENCVDGRKICLVLRAKCDNITEEFVHEFFITVENGVEIGGLISENMTLYPNVHYIVTKTLAIQQGAVLTIKPGTVLKFKAGVGVNFPKGTLNCVGTPDSMIVFTMADNEDGVLQGFDFKDNIMEFTKLSGLKLSQLAGYSIALANLNLKNCVIEYCFNTYSSLLDNATLQKCNLIYSSGYSSLFYNRSIDFLNSNIIGNTIDETSPFTGQHNYASSNVYGNIGKQSGNIFNIAFWTGDPFLYTPKCPNYLGSAREDIIRRGLLDMNNPIYIGFGVYDLSNMLTRPNAEAHGVVWKVVVNGYDAQDEFELLPPLGVGKHKFDVYFNRPMDVSVAPTVAMGVRSPYTQLSIAEDGAWSADSLIYTAYLTIDGKTNSDGLNRIYVAGARDNEFFDIPVENRRFNVEVAAAGSMATGLMAEAGLGKVTLTWETDEEDFEDLLGYNIYRYTMNDGISSDSIIVNDMVLESEEVEFTDFDVVPGTTYYYVIKQITTSLNSHALSNAVAATPLTAQKGDANGSMGVDIADVVTEVAWLTNQNPQPFIFEAADVNSDENVNILDVVGTVTIITNPQAAGTASVATTATYTVEDGILYIDSDVAVGGVQLSIAAPRGTQFQGLEALDGFEQMTEWTSDNECLFLAFSMTGKSIAPGKQAILRIGDAEIKDIVISNSRGGNLLAVNGNTTGLGAVEAMQIQLPYPNPFNTVLTIPYIIGKEGNHSVEIAVTDIAGRAIHRHATVNSFGEYSYTWTPATSLADGLYFVSLYVDGTLMQTAKVIYKK